MFISFLIILFLGSCNKNEEECKTCKTPPPDTIETLSINVENKKEEIKDVSIWKNNSTYSFDMADTRVSDEIYDNIDNITNDVINETQKSILTVFYLDQAVSKNKNIDFVNIKGISKFYLDGNMLLHNFYLKTKDKFIKDKYLSVHVNSVSMNGIYGINSNVVKTNTGSILMIDKKKGVDFEIKNKVDVLRKIAVGYYEIKNQINDENPSEENIFITASREVDVAGNCGTRDCSTQANSFCARDLSNMYPVSYICQSENPPPKGGGSGGGLCRTQQNRAQLLQGNSMTLDSINGAHDDTLHYNIRSLINNSTFGQKYNDYYYYFSNVYATNVTIPIAIKTARVLYKFNTQLDKLLNPNLYGSQIFLTTAMKNEIVGLINDYKLIYNDAYNNAFLNDMLNDMNTYQNQTVSQIRALF
jgi:hypothetical protein